MCSKQCLGMIIVEMTSNGKDSKMDVLEMRPIPALRNSIPYNCLEVYEKNKREEMQHCGDFKYLMDYVKRGGLERIRIMLTFSTI